MRSALFQLVRVVVCLDETEFATVALIKLNNSLAYHQHSREHFSLEYR